MNEQNDFARSSTGDLNKPEVTHSINQFPSKKTNKTNPERYIMRPNSLIFQIPITRIR